MLKFSEAEVEEGTASRIRDVKTFYTSLLALGKFNICVRY